MRDPTSRSGSVVVGLGEVLWDILPGGARLGGAPANFAAHAAALGADAFVVSSVGSDELAEQTVSELERLSVDTSHLSSVDAATGTVLVEICEGQPTYSIIEDVAWDRCPWSPSLADFADCVDAVCFGTLFQRSVESRETLTRFLSTTRESCLRVFDVNLRQAFYSDEIIENSLKLANVLKLNDEELPLVAKAVGVSSQREDFAESMIEKFELRMLMLTAGEGGSFLFTSESSSFCESEKVDVIDTVGAGDAFAAAVVMGMLEGRPIPEMHRHATKLASEVCCVAGAMPAEP